MTEVEVNSTTHEYSNHMDPAVRILFILFESVIAILAVSGNLLVIIAFAKEPKLRRQTNYYIISLVCADFLVGLVGIPFGILLPFTDLPLSGVSWCTTRISLLIAFCNVSIMSLVVISVKRYIILSANPPRQNDATSKIFIKELCLCWIVGAIIGFVPMYSHQRVKKSCLLNDVLSKEHIIFRFTFLIIIPVIALGIIYIKIYKIILNQINKERELKTTDCQLTNQKTNEKLMRREIRTTITISFIVLMFLTAWIPVHIVYILPAIDSTIVVNKNILAFTVNFAHSNSALNPFLYAYRMKDIRKVIFKQLRFHTADQSSSFAA